MARPAEASGRNPENMTINKPLVRYSAATLLGFTMAAFTGGGEVRAGLIASDGFNYPPGTSLTGVTGPLGFASAYTTSTTSSAVSAPGFTYGDLPVSGNKVDFAGTNSASAVLASSPETPGTSVYLSYLMRVDPTTGSAGLSLYQGTTETLFTGKRSGSPNVFGIDPKTGTAANSTVSCSHLALVVYRIDFAAASATIKMYVNPQSNVEPATPDLVVAKTSALTYDRIRIQSSGATGSVDEFRLGTTFADVSPVTYGSIAREVVVLGSSVAAGTGASPLSQAWAYRLQNLLENQAPIVPGSHVGWQVDNASVGGDNTQRVLNRFQTDVATAHTDANMVVIALSLANEGLQGATDPQAVYDSFKSGVTQIISNCRAEGFYPIISLAYPNGAYTANEYAYVKRMNLLLNTWDLPSINSLGAIDDGAGHWAVGNFYDGGHPNSLGHGEMFSAIVPSLFDAIAAGKTGQPQWLGTRGYLRLQRDAAETSPIRFVPVQSMQSFTLSLRARSTDVGTIAAVGAGPNRVTLEMRDTSLVYIGPTGTESSIVMDANDGAWHDIALSHRHASGQSLVFVDGLLQATVSDQYVPDSFTVGGAAGAAGRALAPQQADYQDVAIYRAAWTPEEALAQSSGALQQASLEICAPLADAEAVQGSVLENRAQSLAKFILQTANGSPRLTSTTPDGLNATFAGGTSVNLAWTDHAGGAGAFTIERRRTGVAEAWVTAGTSPGSSPSFVDSGLATAVSYDYRVSVPEGTLHGDYSNVASVVTMVVPLANTELFWDGDADTTAATGGTGTWNSGDSLWRIATTGGALQQYDNTDPSFVSAHLGGTAGTLTINAGTTINANKVVFETTGYSLAGGAGSVLNLSGVSPVITGNGTTTISTKITGAAGFTQSGGSFTVVTGDLTGLSGAVNVATRLNLNGTTVTGSQNQTWNVTGTLTSENHGVPSTVQIGALTGNGTLRIGNNGAGTIDSGTDTFQIGATNLDTTFSGAITNHTAAITAIKKVGTGTLTLSGPTSYTGATTVSAGALTVAGTGTGGAVSMAGTATTLNVTSTGVVTVPSLTQGNAASDVGVVNHTAGTFTSSGDIALGNSGGYGAYNLAGGTLNVAGFRGGSTAGGGNGFCYFHQTGGTVNVSTITTLNRNGTGTCVWNIDGAGAIYNQSGNNLNLGYAAGGTGIVTVSAGSLAVNTVIGLCNNGSNGILNLNGGTTRTNNISLGAGVGSGISVVNLNGGILKANMDSTTFMTGLTNAIDCSGGAIIDTNGKNITIGQALLSSGDSMGINNIPILTGGSGYLAAPVVTISGGGGRGASAITNLAGGVVTGITMTSAGTGYTSAPTVSLAGGGPLTAAITGSVVISTNAGDGGLTKVGAGTLILSGGNTYTGTTVVNGGTFNLASTGRLTFAVTDIGNTGIAGTGAVAIDGSFYINASAVSISSGTWTLIDTPTLASCTYGAGFSPGSGWEETTADVWTLVDGAKTWTFSQASGKLSLSTAGGSYASWIGGFFPRETDSAIIGAGADPDHDGVANVVEMVIGGNPSTGNDTALLPTIELIVDPAGVAPGNFFLFTFRRTDLSVASSVASVCEYATDLSGPWTSAQDGVNGVTILVDHNYASFVPPASDTDRCRVFIPKAVSPGLFARLNTKL